MNIRNLLAKVLRSAVIHVYVSWDTHERLTKASVNFTELKDVGKRNTCGAALAIGCLASC